MQAEASDLASLTWLQDLPQRIQHQRQQQQQQLHGTQQECEAEDVEEAEDQTAGMQAQVLLLRCVFGFDQYRPFVYSSVMCIH